MEGGAPLNRARNNGPMKKQSKPILVSGIKPTGELHLGNYVGMLKNAVALQGDYQAIYFIVDYHALTVDITASELTTNTRRMAVDALSVGINPRQSIFFRQSDVPEHAELAWIFNCLTPIMELERMTQYKDMRERNKSGANAGLYTYPVLQAADILIYHGEFVPVGEDQLQHLELSRVIARKFNKRYGNYFAEIKPLLTTVPRLMSLNDPMKKMSKSLGPKSYLALRDAPDVVREKISKAVTDSLDGDSTSLGGGHNLLTLYKEFGDAARYKRYERLYELKELSYADLKKDLTDAIIKFLKPIQIKQTSYDKRPKDVERILLAGAKRARAIAKKTIAEVRQQIGFP